MTNEFAIKVLTELKGYGDKFANIGFDRKEALDMAIKALEQQPCETIHGSTYGGVSWGGTYKPQQPCEDCISILNRIMEYTYGMLTTEKYGLQHLIKSMMDELSSVTPKARWIPVSEEPKETGSYITTIKYGDKYAVGQRYYHGKYIGWEDSCVIAYMPLPQPYKESEDKK